MTLLVVLLIVLTFSVILTQEWRSVHRSNRYVVKLGQARTNIDERRKGV